MRTEPLQLKWRATLRSRFHIANSRDSATALESQRRDRGSEERNCHKKEMAQGRGRGQTLPAWMTQGGNDAALDSMLASASQAAAQRELDEIDQLNERVIAEAPEPGAPDRSPPSQKLLPR